ncbi:MAG: glutathione peroxidase [Bacteroidaceae bacterium]|jgi:glutathione peroxidase|nr:glutathione peroxidase [Bacteroidaceae bacterium]
MKKLLFILMSFITLGISAQESVYDFTVKGLNNEDVSLKDYSGKVLLIVNTATKCGFTPQYKELQALYEKYQARGFEVLDFPCNQFGEQAPGTNEEIHDFCTGTYNTTFAQFAKIDVNGENEAPIFKFLKEKQGFKGFETENNETGKMMDQMMSRRDPDYKDKSDIKWNFTKFLVNKKGEVIARFEPSDSMMKLETAIRRNL